MNPRIISTLFFLFIVSFCAGQSVMSKGYLIDQSGERKEGFIKNEKWYSNPEVIEYKESERSNTKQYELVDIQEFGIYDVVKFVRSSVSYDVSSTDLSNLSSSKTPEFLTKDVLLKVILEGDKSLYEYRESDIERYFIGNGKTIDPLIYKPYSIVAEQINYNRQYRQQLWNELQCAAIDEDQFANLEYNKRDLLEIFDAYFKCSGQVSKFEDNSLKESQFRITPLLRMSRSSFEMGNSTTTLNDVTIAPTLSYSFGLRLENIFPFNGNRWAVVGDLSYDSYQSTQYFEYNNIIPDDTLSVNYKYLTANIGIRHYFNITNDLQLFITPSLGFDLNMNSSLTYANGSDLDISGPLNIAASLGMRMLDKWTLELRYIAPRNLLKSYVSWNSSLETISMIAGYSLWSTKKRNPR